MNTNIAPTKSNLIKVKQNLKFAHEGYDLLKQKRDILVAELMNSIDAAEAVQKQIDEHLAGAYDTLLEAIAEHGELQVAQIAGAVNIEYEINIYNRKVMGVVVPNVKTNITDNPPYYSLSGVPFRIDETLSHFKEVLKLLERYAELKISVLRLSHEVKKTIRRVNALEKIALPDLEKTVKHIRAVLEENERDSFIIMKLVKNRLNAGR